MIRYAQKKDIKFINKLANNLVKNFVQTYNVEKYIDDDKYIILVNDSNPLNGILMVFKNIDFYELELLYVDEKYRNKGIGTQLLDYFIQNIVKGEQDVFLEVAVNNEVAINFYKKFGFEVINVRKKYYQGVDAFIMKRGVRSWKMYIFWV